jgi:hypothetical protein
MNYLIEVLVLVLVVVSAKEIVTIEKLLKQIRELENREIRVVPYTVGVDKAHQGPDGTYPPTMIPGLYFESEESISDDLELVKEYRKQALHNPYRGLEVFDEE